MDNKTLYDAIKGANSLGEALLSIANTAEADHNYAMLADAQIQLESLEFMRTNGRKITYEDPEFYSIRERVHGEMGDRYFAEGMKTDAAEQYGKSDRKEKAIDIYLEVGNIGEAKDLSYECGILDRLLDIHINNSDFEGAFIELQTYADLKNDPNSPIDYGKWVKYISKAAYKHVKDQLAGWVEYTTGKQTEGITFDEMLDAIEIPFPYGIEEYTYLKKISWNTRYSQDPEMIGIAVDLAELEKYVKDGSSTYFMKDSTYYNAMDGDIFSIEAYVSEATTLKDKRMLSIALRILIHNDMNERALELASEYLDPEEILGNGYRLSEIGGEPLITQAHLELNNPVEYAVSFFGLAK